MNPLGPPPQVCLITPGDSNSDNYPTQKELIVSTVRQAALDGVSLIQVREKKLPTRLLSDLVSEIKSVARSVNVVVNDRVDVAVAAGAEGVHLAETSLPVAVVRRSFGGILIGASVHSLSAAEAAVRDGADYVLFGPIFDTPGKGAPVGIETLAEVCRRVQGFPVIALGGIDETNCQEVVEAGAAGIAAIRALNNAASRKKILDKIRGRPMA